MPQQTVTVVWNILKPQGREKSELGNLAARVALAHDKSAVQVLIRSDINNNVRTGEKFISFSSKNPSQVASGKHTIAHGFVEGKNLESMNPVDVVVKPGEGDDNSETDHGALWPAGLQCEVVAVEVP